MNKNDQEYVLRWAKKFMAIKLLGGKCSCGGVDPITMMFHHHTKGNKECGISRMLGYRWSVIVEELKKCELACANCHCSKHIVDKRQIKIKKSMLDLKGNTSCLRCGYDGLALDFHHTDEARKEFDFSNLVARKFSIPIDLILAELDKCVVLCHSCHIKEHFDFDKFNELLPIIKQKVKKYKECPPEINRDVVLKLFEEGHSKAEIARVVGCAKSTITYITKGV